MAGVYTGTCTTLFEVRVGSQFDLNGRTQVYIPNTLRVANADLYNSQTRVLSAGLSAEALTLAPLGVSAPAMLVQLTADRPVDVRTNTAQDVTFLSGVQYLLMLAAVSNLFLTTGSAVTTVRLELVGGSAAAATVSLPLP